MSEICEGAAGEQGRCAQDVYLLEKHRVFFTYCSPAFWPQILSEESVGSAGPLEEAEEPQTLEQQHPEQQSRQGGQRRTEAVDRKRKTMSREGPRDLMEEIIED